MKPRARAFAALGLLGLLWQLCGCAGPEEPSLTDQVRPFRTPVDAAAAVPVGDACERAATFVSDDGCRVDWQCPRGALRSLVCAGAGDAGVVCVCAEDEDVFGSDAGLQDDCSQNAQVPALAQRVCGWDVP